MAIIPPHNECWSILRRRKHSSSYIYPLRRGCGELSEDPAHAGYNQNCIRNVCIKLIKNCMRDVTCAHICVFIFCPVSVATSCEVSHCGYKQMFTIKDGRAFISSKAKVWSALGDSYYCTFDGGDFALQGNCNYTLVQTTCAGLNTSIPLKSNIVRAYLNSATVSTIHLVQMEFRVSHHLG